MSEVTITPLLGPVALPFLGELAELRIAVFREYPYLYDGSREYEERYLRGYAQSPRALVVLARDGERVVGAATAVPLVEHGDEVVPVFEAAGIAPSDVYYFGESVLRVEYRGRGVGHAFFDAREAAARAGGFRIATFCAVDRGADHPARPAGYVPHDAFWTKRGYVKRPDLVARFSWKDLGAAAETEKPMVFWIRELSA